MTIEDDIRADVDTAFRTSRGPPDAKYLAGLLVESSRVWMRTIITPDVHRNRLGVALTKLRESAALLAEGPDGEPTPLSEAIRELPLITPPAA
jgi:hypothetical protein